jgi:hypothetical protein
MSESSVTNDVRDLKIRVLPDFTRRPGTFRLRQRFIRLSARMMELDELTKQDDEKSRREMAKLFREYDALLELVLRSGCEVEGGTIEEALDNLSADEADELFRQIFGLSGNNRFFESGTNGSMPVAS